MRNLEHIHFHEKQEITQYVQHALSNSQNNAYDVSKLILMAGLLGDRQLYRVAYQSIVMKTQAYNEKLASFETSENRQGLLVWLLGRMSFAQYLMEGLAANSSSHISGERISQHNIENQSEFSAWGTAYRAIGLTNQEYINRRQQILNEANQVTSGKPEFSADMAWVWVMVIYAAAHQNDKDTYKTAWSKIQNINELLGPDDSKAWALAMLYSSAQMMQDNTKMDALITPLRQSIADPRTKEGDRVLAQLTFQLAKESSRLSATQDHALRNAYQYMRGLFSCVSSSLNVTRHKNTNTK